MEKINEEYYDQNLKKIAKIEQQLKIKKEDRINNIAEYNKKYLKNKKKINILKVISEIILLGSLIPLTSCLTIMAMMGTVPILMIFITFSLLFIGPYMYAAAKGKMNDNEEEMRKFTLNDKQYDKLFKDYEDELDIRYILHNCLENNYIENDDGEKINEILSNNSDIHSNFTIEELLIFLKNTNDSANIGSILIDGYKENASTNDKDEILAILKEVGSDPKIAVKFLNEIGVCIEKLQECLENTNESLESVFNNSYEEEYDEYEQAQEQLKVRTKVKK